MPSLRQSEKPLEQLSQRHLRFAELLADGRHSKTECMRQAGFAENFALYGKIIGPSREQSKYPALWDYYNKRRRERLRLFEDDARAIRNELQIIAYSKITNFVSIPTAKDLERQALLDAQIRRVNGYQDAEDDDILARAQDILRDEIVNEPSQLKKKRLDNLLPGSTVRIKCLDDIPEELIPAIASIAETRDGIRLTLWDKIKAIDILAKITRQYDDPNDNRKPTVINKLNIIVNGTKSDLLKAFDL